MGLSKLSMLAFAGLAAAELPAIHVTGSKFFYENGTQFFMKGIAYQQDTAANGQTNDKASKYIDPLADEDNCKRDVPLLEKLGVNTIRTYAINPDSDHKACMKLLEDAGIYVISDLSEPSLSIQRDDPQWNTELYERYTGVVDELAQYSNVIGFFAGNEVSDANNNTAASAYVKAAVRDTKKYIKSKGYPLGVGYATNDHPDIRDKISAYFNCGKAEEAADFWGYNIYSWCGDSNMKDSGYANWVKFYQDYNVPVFFAEYGCNEPGGAEGRKFDDTRALFSDEMTGVFSGGLVYRYFQEENDYGVVEVKNGKATEMKNFQALKKAHAQVDPKGVSEDDYKAPTDRQECPEIGEYWIANSVLPPTPDDSLCKCAVAASGCAVNDEVKPKDFGKMFGYICGENGKLCTAINGNATTGVYGAYSMCEPRDKLSILLGMYYEDLNSDSSACDFDGKASTKDAEDDDKCSDALASASAVNEEAATATAPVTGATGGADDAEDDDSFGIMNAPIARLFSIGDMAVGMYMVAALGVGAAMVAL